MNQKFRYRNYEFEEFIKRHIREADNKTIANLDDELQRKIKRPEKFMEYSNLDEKLFLLAKLNVFTTISNHDGGVESFSEWTKIIRNNFKEADGSSLIKDKFFFIQSTTQVAKVTSLMSSHFNSKFFIRDKNWGVIARTLLRFNSISAGKRENEETKLLYKFLFYYSQSSKIFQISEGLGAVHLLILIYMALNDEGSVSRQQILKVCMPIYALRTVNAAIFVLNEKKIIGSVKKKLTAKEIKYFMLPKAWNILGDMGKYISEQIERH